MVEAELAPDVKVDGMEEFEKIVERHTDPNAEPVKADELYKSNASVDFSPREPKEPKEAKGEDKPVDGEQLNLIDTSDEKGDSAESLTKVTERKFKTELTLKLADTTSGKAITIPILCGEYFGKRIQELLILALNTDRNQKIIEAVLDNPQDDVEEKTYSFILNDEEYLSFKPYMTAKEMLKLIELNPSEFQIVRVFKDGKEDLMTLTSETSFNWNNVSHYFTRKIVQAKRLVEPAPEVETAEIVAETSDSGNSRSESSGEQFDEPGEAF